MNFASGYFAAGLTAGTLLGLVAGRLLDRLQTIRKNEHEHEHEDVEGEEDEEEEEDDKAFV